MRSFASKGIVGAVCWAVGAGAFFGGFFDTPLLLLGCGGVRDFKPLEREDEACLCTAFSCSLRRLLLPMVEVWVFVLVKV